MVGRGHENDAGAYADLEPAAHINRVLVRGGHTVVLPPEHRLPEREARLQLGLAAWDLGVSVKMRRIGQLLQMRRQNFVVRTSDRFISSMGTLQQVIGMAALHEQVLLVPGNDDPPADRLVPAVVSAAMANRRRAKVWAIGGEIHLLIPRPAANHDPAPADSQSTRSDTTLPEHLFPPAPLLLASAETGLDPRRIRRAMNEVPPW